MPSKRKFHLVTPYGHNYYIHDDGTIERGDMPGYSFKEWVFLGIKHVSQNVFIPFKELDKKLDSIEWKYKSSLNPQWTVRGLDHGSEREWGNTKYHGISSIKRV